MANPIKYNASSESKALKVNNFWFGTGDVDKGPTSSTGFYNGITPPSGGYTIYLNKASFGPSIYVASDDAQLIDLTNKIANTSYTGVTECLNYFRGQSDKAVFNRQYEAISTDGLVLNLDGDFVSSYPHTGSTWYDLSGNGNNGTLENGADFDKPTGAITFDGTNDRVVVANSSSIGLTGDMTIIAWVNITDFINYRSIVSKTNSSGFAAPFDLWLLESTGIPYFWRGNGSGVGGSVSGTAAPSTGTWQQVGVTMSGTSVVHYLNGVPNGTGTLNTSIGNDVNVPMYVGNREDGVTRMKGKYGKLLMYNRALSQAEVLQNFNITKETYIKSIVTNGMVLNLDAADNDSYPGSGTTWFDLSGNGRNHTLYNTSLTTYQGVSGFNCFPSGWITQTTGTPITFSQEYTMIVWGNAPTLTENMSWRTMLRTQTNDHPLLIHPSGGGDADKIGYFDNNNGGGFVYYGSTLEGIGQNDKWTMYTLVGTGGSTYLYYNNGNLVGSVPYSVSGENHDTIGNVNNGSQPFGYIGSTMIYNRALSLGEIQQNYNAQKSRFGL